MEDTFLTLFESVATAPALAQPWTFLRPSINVREIPSGCEVPAHLIELASSQGLPLDRIIATGSDGRPVWSPVVGGGPFLVLREKRNGPPVDLVSMRGRLLDTEPPALFREQDETTHARAAKFGFILVAFSDRDLAVLRCLGLPVTPAAGLAKVTARQARRLLSPAGNSTTGTPSLSDVAAVTPQPPLVLVAVELSQLKNQMPAGVLHVATQLLRVERTLKLSTDRVALWLPEAAEFRQICDATRLAAPNVIRDVIVESIRRSRQSIGEYFRSTTIETPNDLGTWRRKLSTAIETLPTAVFGTRNVATGVGEFSRAYDVEIIGRIHDAAQAAADPLDRALWLSAAELMEIHFHMSELPLRARAVIETGSVVNMLMTVEERLHSQSR